MAEKAKVRYRVEYIDTFHIAENEVESEKTIKVFLLGLADTLVVIHGDAKSVYVHKANLVSIIIDKTSDTE